MALIDRAIDDSRALLSVLRRLALGASQVGLNQADLATADALVTELRRKLDALRDLDRTSPICPCDETLTCPTCSAQYTREKEASGIRLCRTCGGAVYANPTGNEP